MVQAIQWSGLPAAQPSPGNCKIESRMFSSLAVTGTLRLLLCHAAISWKSDSCHVHLCLIGRQRALYRMLVTPAKGIEMVGFFVHMCVHVLDLVTASDISHPQVSDLKSPS